MKNDDDDDDAYIIMNEVIHHNMKYIIFSSLRQLSKEGHLFPKSSANGWFSLSLTVKAHHGGV